MKRYNYRHERNDKTYDNLDGRFHRFKRNSTTSQESTATGWDDDRVDVRNLLKNLKSSRALASQNAWVVESENCYFKILYLFIHNII